MLTYQDIRYNDEINTYIKKGNDVVGALGITDHGYAHATICAHKAAEILEFVGCDGRTVELAKIAGYMHDIGNCINRKDHAQSGAVMAFTILNNLGMDKAEIADIICAIGHHDESLGGPVSPIAAALILADKADVRRSRVRHKKMSEYDIHDKVNHSVDSSELYMEDKIITLKLHIDTELSPVMTYFEIFMDRMLLCRRAAEALGLHFALVINDSKIL